MINVVIPQYTVVGIRMVNRRPAITPQHTIVAIRIVKTIEAQWTIFVLGFLEGIYAGL